jgi:hypothetical protein
MKLLEALPGHVRIDLSRRYVAVPEQHLHDTQIGAVVDEMRGERVPQHMG